MDYKSIFQKSFICLKNNQVLVVPLLLSTLFSLVVLIGFLQISGFLAILQEIGDAIDIQETMVDSEEAIGQLLEGSGILEKITGLLTIENGMYLLITVILIFSVSYYLNWVSLSLIGLVLQRKTSSLGEGVSITNKRFGRMVWLDTLTFLLYCGPLLLALLIVIAAFMIGNFLGFLLLALFVIGAVGYVIFLYVRLLFSRPILLLRDMGPKDSLKESYVVTKYSMGNVAICALIITGMGLATQWAVASPSGNMLISAAIATGVKKVLSLFGGIAFLFVSIVLMTYQKIFLFVAYEDHVTIIGPPTKIRKSNANKK